MTKKEPKYLSVVTHNSREEEENEWISMITDKKTTDNLTNAEYFDLIKHHQIKRET